MDLCINTSTIRTSLTLGNENGFFTFYSKKKVKPGFSLIYGLKKLLKRKKAKIEDIDKIYFTIGPGSFTGIRTGMAFIFGFSAGKNIKLFPISTLSAISLKEEGISTSIIPYGNDYFYFGVYKISKKILEIKEPKILKKEEIIKEKIGKLLILGEYNGFENAEVVKEPLSEIIFKKRKFIKEKKLPIKPIYLKNPYEIK